MGNSKEQQTWYGVAIGLIIGSFLAAAGYSLPADMRGFFFAVVYLIATGLMMYKIAKYKKTETKSEDD